MSKKVYGIQEYEELPSGDYGQVVSMIKQASGPQLFTIPAGSYTSYPTDLGAWYDIIRIYCADASYIAASTYVYAYCSPSYPDYPMGALYSADTMGCLWQGGYAPTSGAFDLYASDAAGTRFLALALSNPAGGDLDFLFYASGGNWANL